MYFSTRSVPRAERREAWFAVMNKLCGDFARECSAEDIDAAIDVRNVGKLECLRVWQPSPSRAQRTAKQISNNNPGRYVLKMQLVGQSHIEQNNHSVTISPGEVIILDSARPVSFRCDTKCHFLALHVPKELLDGRGVEWEDYLATHCPAPTAAMLQSILMSAFEWSPSLSEGQCQIAGDAALSLLSAGFLSEIGDEMSCSETSFTAQNLLKSIWAHIFTHLSDESLSPSLIAKAHHISERQLHRLFEPLGISVSRYIRKARLERCAKAFRDPACLNMSITEIAFRNGFSDSAYFSHLFRNEFGDTPRQYRMQAKRYSLSQATRPDGDIFKTILGDR